MSVKKITVILSSVLIISGLVGGVIAVEDRYAKCGDVIQLAERIDRKILRDDIRDYEKQKWYMEREYGKEKAKTKREYKEIEYKQKELREELKGN